MKFAVEWASFDLGQKLDYVLGSLLPVEPKLATELVLDPSAEGAAVGAPDPIADQSVDATKVSLDVSSWLTEIKQLECVRGSGKPVCYMKALCESIQTKFFNGSGDHTSCMSTTKSSTPQNKHNNHQHNNF